MRLRRAAPTLLLAPLLALLSPAGTAAADPTDTGGIDAPTLTIGIASISGAIRVRGFGTSHVIGAWTFHVAGTRTSLSPLQVPISYDVINPGTTSFDETFDVLKLDAAAGEVEFTLAFGGGRGSTTTDRPAAVHGVAAWAPGQPDTWVVTTGG